MCIRDSPEPSPAQRLLSIAITAQDRPSFAPAPTPVAVSTAAVRGTSARINGSSAPTNGSSASVNGSIASINGSTGGGGPQALRVCVLALLLLQLLLPRAHLLPPA
eukprot:1408135-Rhodomonas_salina.3